MYKIERHAKMLQIIRKEGFIKHNELANIFGVSIVTIRRDLKILSEQNLIKLEHGGSTVIDYLVDVTEPLYKSKLHLNTSKKDAIGTIAVSLINDGDTLILDSGTTSLQVANHLKNAKLNNLTIFTSDLMVAKELCPVQKIQIIILGGILRTGYYNTYGEFAISTLEKMKVNKLFLGVDAVSIGRCVSNLIIEEVSLKQKMIEICNEITIIADSKKFGIDAPFQVCEWSKITNVITDDEISSEFIDLFESLGIDKYIAHPNTIKT